MAEYRHSAHATFDLKYHVIWITKYRYKILRGRIAERSRDLIRQVCQARDVVIVRGAVSPDHIHMLLSAPPHLAPAKLVPGDWPIPNRYGASRATTVKLRPRAWRASQRRAGVSRTSRPGGWRQMRSHRNSPWARPRRGQKSDGEAD